MNRLVLVAAAWTLASIAFGCPNCASAIAANDKSAAMPMAFNYSILFMMAMPFTLLTFFIGMAIRLSKQARRDEPSA